MWKLNDLELISLLSGASQEVTNEEMQNAYGCFTEHMKAVGQTENDYSEIFRTLNLTRIEFDSLGSLPLYGQGGKCPEICLS